VKGLVPVLFTPIKGYTTSNQPIKGYTTSNQPIKGYTTSNKPIKGYATSNQGKKTGGLFFDLWERD